MFFWIRLIHFFCSFYIENDYPQKILKYLKIVWDPYRKSVQNHTLLLVIIYLLYSRILLVENIFFFKFVWFIFFADFLLSPKILKYISWNCVRIILKALYIIPTLHWSIFFPVFYAFLNLFILFCGNYSWQSL